VPAVSVVVPTFDRAALLAEALASVLRQSFADLELIVIDDGSSDGTAGMVQSVADPRLRYLPLAHCGNLSILRNTGIRASRGRLVAFLDSDDLWHEDKLAAQVAFLEAHAEAGFVFSGYEVFGAAGVVHTQLYDGDGAASTLRQVFDDLIRGRMVIFSSSFLGRRELLDRTGLLDERLRTGDYELFTRLAWASPAGILHEPLVRVRRHTGNTSRRWNAEGLVEAIVSVRRFYRLGAIDHEVRDDRLLKYLQDLAIVLSARGDLRGARRAALGCLRLRPFAPEHWRRLWNPSRVPAAAAVSCRRWRGGSRLGRGGTR
jgi:glycosyltransferase involved in cell wall biosynthesis